MRIISKFKDYYDYIQGIYGVDEKLILDRTTFYKMPYVPTDYINETFYIGEYMIQGIWLDGICLFGDDILNHPKIEFYKAYGKKDDDIYYIKNSIYGRDKILKKIKFLGDKSPTYKQDYPILLSGNNKILKCPILKDYGIQKILPAEEIWKYLSDWLSRRISNNEKPVPIGDDKTRILSHGFDLKTSFRK
jgi:hypothetical protein